MGADTRRLPFLIASLCGIVIAYGLLGIWLSYRGQKDLAGRVPEALAAAAAAEIQQYIQGLEAQIGWTTQQPWSPETLDQRRFDAVRLFRQVPAIAEIAYIDASGRERLHLSRTGQETTSEADVSRQPRFTEATGGKVYYGPLYFRLAGGTEAPGQPAMVIAIGGTRAAIVVAADIDLKPLSETMRQTKIGERAVAYIVDGQGRLIAHPDFDLVVRGADLSGLAQVKAARAAGVDGHRPLLRAKDFRGQGVVAASAAVSPLDWSVIVELPIEDAYAPVYASALHLSALLFAALALVVLTILLFERTAAPTRTPPSAPTSG
jgi:two-component system NtrC family sensor kinase